MLDGHAAAAALQTCGVTHLVWIPDSHLGSWESALNQGTIPLIRACREGEAIAIAGGLLLGGKKPVVIMQCTGLFEAGDALRNIVHDLQLPLVMIIGVRSYYARQAGRSQDNCPDFTIPILDAWKIPWSLYDTARADAGEFIAQLRRFHREEHAGAILIPE